MEIYPFWIVSSIHNRWISVVVLAVVGNLPQIPKRAKYQRCISNPLDRKGMYQMRGFQPPRR